MNENYDALIIIYLVSHCFYLLLLFFNEYIKIVKKKKIKEKKKKLYIYILYRKNIFILTFIKLFFIIIDR